MIFSQPPNSSWTLLVFLPPGKGVLQTGRKTEHRGPWDSSFVLKKPSLLLGLTPHSIPIIIPSLRLSLLRDPNPHRLLVIPPSLSPICEGSPRPITHCCFLVSLGDLQSGCFELDPSSVKAMASDDSSSSGVNAETRIGSLEAAMGQLRIKMDANDKKIDAVSKAGEKSWDLLNTELRQLRDDLSENLNEFKEETRTSFKDEANIQGDFGNRIATLELEVAKLKSKLEN